ncbi:unnamed protein product, partial [Polarella glacialis]
MSRACREAISGAVAGVAALSLTYPLYAMVVQLQMHELGDASLPSSRADVKSRSGRKSYRELLRRSNWRGMYKGQRAALVAVFIQTGIYYWFYYLFRVFHAAPVEGAALWHLLIGFEAGIATTLLTNPLWVVNLRQMTELPD